jgi:hypothetical protein
MLNKFIQKFQKLFYIKIDNTLVEDLKINQKIKDSLNSNDENIDLDKGKFVYDNAVSLLKETDDHILSLISKANGLLKILLSTVAALFYLYLTKRCEILEIITFNNLLLVMILLSASILVCVKITIFPKEKFTYSKSPIELLNPAIQQDAIPSILRSMKQFYILEAIAIQESIIPKNTATQKAISLHLSIAILIFFVAYILLGFFIFF